MSTCLWLFYPWRMRGKGNSIVTFLLVQLLKTHTHTIMSRTHCLKNDSEKNLKNIKRFFPISLI